MTEPVFSIQLTPQKMHRLRQSVEASSGGMMEVDRGLYKTHADALDAIDIILNPRPIAYFDKDGAPIHAEIKDAHGLK